MIFCTSRDRENDVVKALQAGAQDYVRKPIRRMELQARINTVTRRAEIAEANPEDFDFDSIRVNFSTQTVTRDGAPIDMTSKDFDLAVLFFKNLGRLLPRSYIAQTVWRENAPISSRTIDTQS